MRASVWFILLTVAIGICLFGGCEDKKPTETDDPNLWTFRKVSGDGQSIVVWDTLPQRMVVELKDGLKKPIESEQVRFEVIDGNGTVAAKPTVSASPAEVFMPTDGYGRAACSYQCFDTGLSVIEVKVVSRPELIVQFTVTGLASRTAP